MRPPPPPCQASRYWRTTKPRRLYALVRQANLVKWCQVAWSRRKHLSSNKTWQHFSCLIPYLFFAYLYLCLALKLSSLPIISDPTLLSIRNRRLWCFCKNEWIPKFPRKFGPSYPFGKFVCKCWKCETLLNLWGILQRYIANRSHECNYISIETL